jgi:N-acetylglucosaminyl-diphospho-decaprenol L-rhamnosyltransferase
MTVTSSVGLPAIIFVNHHSEDLILPRAERLLRAGFVVRVADNSSTYPDSEVRVETGGNIGFGAACNRAVDALPHTVTSVCLHNPDVTVEQAAISRLGEHLASLSRTGACAPAVRVGNRIRLNGFHYPGLAREAFISLRGTQASRREETVGRKAVVIPSEVRQSVGNGRRFASGALMVIDRDAFESIGGFDERYFLYCEDLDLWHRLGAAGYTTDFVPEVVAHHDAATGGTATRGTRELLRWVGVELFAETHSYSSWRRMRQVHRHLIERLGNVRPSLLGTVSDMWSRSATPAETSQVVRLLAASGDL